MRFEIIQWRNLHEDEKRAALSRPAQATEADRRADVGQILRAVRERGDRALRELTTRYDGIEIDDLRVQSDEFAAAEDQLPTAAIDAIDTAVQNVRTFHSAQRPNPIDLETTPGVRCQRISQPLDAVGLYVPAGSAPLPSTAIMLCVPATLAGCGERVLCTPPRHDGTADPSVLVAARRSGVDKVFTIGGAQAIAAMAYGTESVPRVNKIFGPGNAWVTSAKALVAGDVDGAAIDLPAGPSEVLVIADDTANPDFAAADLLSQAEHGEDSQAVLVCISRQMAEAVAVAVDNQLQQLTRREIAAKSLAHSRFIVAGDVDEAIEISNQYAPEHLILQVGNSREQLANVRNAGSVFLGAWSPEAAGDYCSGTNHVLPTYGWSRSYSGLSLADFMRQMTVQELSRSGIDTLGSAIIALAELEGLDAHAAAVRVRMNAPEGRPE
ncbi:MAG: histidinol dehydrogenase [Pseudomonadota bacterium]